MQRYILKRIGLAILTVFFVVSFIFFLARISGDPLDLMMSEDATEEEWDIMREQLGLDKPIHIQYINYIAGVFTGDFGDSLRWDKPCLSLILDRLPLTLQLTAYSLILSWAFGLFVGVMSAMKVNGLVDRFGKVMAMLGQAMPNFWVGILLIFTFAVRFRIFPTSGRGGLEYFVLPAITLGTSAMASMTRMIRSAMLDILDGEFIKMTRIKGLPEKQVILKHAFKNALIPVLTLGSLQVEIMLSGSVITESIFSLPGMGRLMVDSIFTRDYPLVQACVILTAAIYIAINLIVDITYGYIDPRIRYQ
jgi:ABC-type dipeptide/oligopeptide/nickel transport system permease component